MVRAHARHRIDASWKDAFYALAASPLPTPAGTAHRDGALVCLSVRSAFHLLLETVGWAAGDEVLVSAVTHPDMVRIIVAHGLRPVPVDIDPSTLAPDPVALSSAAGTRSRARAIVVTHLFGARVELGHAVGAARRHDLLLIEDCAQSIGGPHDGGDSRADVSLFSFGFIKTATALGGALAQVRDPELAASMAAEHDRWPVQARSAYAARAARCVAALALSGPRAYATLCHVVEDPGSLVRSKPPEDDDAFKAWLRRRPCGGLLTMLRRRLRKFPEERLRRRAQAGDELAAGLPPGLWHPGEGVGTTHWLFPVVTPDPAKLIRRLRAAGFDATQGASQITALPPAPHAGRMMQGMVFLPCYPELPKAERRRLLGVLHDPV